MPKTDAELQEAYDQIGSTLDAIMFQIGLEEFAAYLAAHYPVVCSELQAWMEAQSER